jgi:hypothetical protein
MGAIFPPRVQRDVIQEALDALPDTPGAIADLLVERGIKGKRDNEWECPAARYVKEAAKPTAPNADVTVVTEIAVDGETWEIPDALNLFIDAFDKGEFPDLDVNADDFDGGTP